MTAYNYLYIITIGLVVFGWGTRVLADDDVTIVSPPVASTNAPTTTALAPDGTPVIHKSLHKKKGPAASASSSSVTSLNATSPPATKPAPVSSAPSTPPPAPAPLPAVSATHLSTPFPAQTTAITPVSYGPAIETGLPIPKHSGLGSITVNDPPPIPTSTALSSGTHLPASGIQHQPPLPTIPPVTPEKSYTIVERAPSSLPPELFDSTGLLDTGKKYKNTYPWKTGIYTTVFWIGEGGSVLSSTDNIASSWDANWRSSNGGSDPPNDRSGYAPGSHAARLNTFYVALPFNDMAYPDKAKHWLPRGWARPPGRDGKPVSACKDRWVEIKTEDGSGHVCYAQWEDVGPLRYDHAEYVFGPERPDTLTRAGLDVSPAVAQYLGINEDKKALTRWRFVDAEDVPPGEWLKYEEDAVIYNVLHEHGKTDELTEPVQKNSEPIDDTSGEKKAGAAHQ